ncbi:MAG: aldo/keto reductase [Firmicutes bacterium]|nr:aldo/keto reductase [Bacillota bacterium]
MELREFKNLGIKTSLLGFGCMRYPKKQDGSIDEEIAERMIDKAYQNGVNYFDTAYVYHEGKSENFTGKALDRYDRSSYYLATKLPCWLVEKAEDAERLLNEQLTRLNKEYVDFYLLHALGRESFDKMVSLGVLEVMDRLKAEGKIKYLGFSFHDDYNAFEHIIKFRKWDFCQIQLNYMDIEEQAGMKGYELAEKLEVPLVIMEPVKGGSLARLPEDAAKHLEKLDAGKSAASWALRWVGSMPNVKVILSGMSDEEQVQDNLNTFHNFKALSDTEKGAIVKVAETLTSRVKNGCTGCAYCMPCPAGVDIPKNFRIWNSYGMYNNEGELNWLWSNDIDDKAKAANCVECGQCEDACPQKLNIRRDLKTLQTDINAVVMK